jgi:putative ABC transport system permease protein
MNLFKIIEVAFRALMRNKARSFLTTLGIIIGVGSVIAMISIGEGAKSSVEERFRSLGTNLLFVRAGSSYHRGVRGGMGSLPTLTPEDAQAIQEKCDAVQYVSPTVSTRAQVIYGNKNWNSSIVGCGEKYPEIRNWTVESGIFFTRSHVNASAKVCLLGKTVVENLFEEGENPVGKIIRVNRIPFTVIGILEKKGESWGWFDQDDVILAPYTTVQKRLLGISHIFSIDVSAVSFERMAEAEEQITELLRVRHKIAPYQEDDFHVRNMSEISQMASETSSMMTILLASIASVSLLVGGIGIMNIMLVSVRERIREIGIRMSVGAKEKDILFQFLTEAVVLSIGGGIIGIIIGIVGSRLISRFAGWNTLVSLPSIFIAFLFAGIVGVFFGFYPAYKASKLNPIEALRYE